MPLETYQYSVSENLNSQYNWIAENGAVISGQGSNVISVQWGSTGAGYLSVVETDDYGCQGEVVNITVQIASTGISNYAKSNLVRIYPNPSIGLVNVEVENYFGTVKTNVYDLLGNLVISTIKKTIITDGLSKGVYLLRIMYGSKTKEVKLIKN